MELVKRILKKCTAPLRGSSGDSFESCVTWSGVFDDFSAVSEKNSYESEGWESELVEEVNAKRLASDGKKVESPSWLSAIYNSVSHFLSGAGLEKVELLDFGGGAGLLFEHLRGSNPNLSIEKYSVVELPKIALVGQSCFSSNDKVRFVSELPDGEIFNVVYVGSALQYLSDYVEVIKKLASLSSEYIFLANHFMGKPDTFVTKQVNMGYMELAYIIFNQQEIVDLVESQGFKLITQTKNFFPMHNFNNFEEEYHNIHSTNLIFKKVN